MSPCWARRSSSRRRTSLRCARKKPPHAEPSTRENRGAELAEGHFDDAGSLEDAARGMDAVFVVATPFEAGPEAETRHGVAAADAARAAGVSHLVYSSVADADKRTGIPHFESKREVEDHIEWLGVPYTIVAPVYFMENLLAPWNLPELKESRLPMALSASRPLQQIALSDIAAFTAMVMEDREGFEDRRVNIASDELTGDEVAGVLSRVTGREIRYVELQLEQVRQAIGEDGALMFEWFDRVGYSADVGSLRREHPEVGWHTFEEWAKQQVWSALG
ncbi:MAG: NmrA family NAD(P)-binding protein [Actinomycetota bacterium]|nr:NmrA family NAD(P)-binding protein [Actinomycetota bacterium]MDP9479137.1 NmrA family NAD(P)-binding protein [Actinomycetota bacterium]MDP9485607.1 NmrA family NAD(P)-binding protein [Actinomycetota bacterium]